MMFVYSLALENDGDAPMTKFNGILCGALMVVGPLAHAQVTTTETTTTTPGTGGTEVRRVSQILGSTVQLQGVNNFGKVEDIILSDDGGIGYLVVSANGKSVLLPWDAGNVEYTKRVVTYDVTPQAVQPLYFERNAYPNISAPDYTTRVRQVFPNVRRAQTVRPDGPSIESTEKVRVRPNGKVIIKEKVKSRDR